MVSDAYHEHVRELLASVPDLRFRKMFGGAGVYSGERIFALIVDDQLYIKADALSRDAFEAAGSSPFSYDPGGGRKPTVMSYWRLPAEAEDDPAAAERWARLGAAAAERATAPKRKGRVPAHDLGPGPWDG